MSRPSPTVRRRRLGQRGMSLVEVSVVVTITGILATLATYSVRERMFEAHSVEAVAMLGSIRSGLLAKADDLTGNSGSTLQVGGRVGGFGGPLGLPGVLGKKKSSTSGSTGTGTSGNGNGNGNGNGSNGGGIDGDGNNGHGNNDDHCDPDNPGNGGGDCSGGDGDSGSDASGDGDDSGDDEEEVDGNNPLCTSANPVPSSIDAVKGGIYQSRPGDWKGGSSEGGWSCLSISISGAQRFQYGYDVGPSAVPTAEAPADADATFAAWARGDLDGDGRTSWFVLNGASYDGRVVMAPAVTIIDQGE